MSSYRTISLKSYSDIRNEYEAAGAILPGSVVALDSDGNVVVNAVAGGPAATMFALEDELQGKTTRDAYASGDRVQTMYVQPGEEVLAVIDSALEPAIGDLLEVAADGELQAAASGVAQFQVLSAKVVDDDSNHRIAVRRI
jgi:hypothetical protein